MLKKLWIFCSLNRKYFLSIPRSLYYNFRLLPFSQAIKVPIFLSNYVTIKLKDGSRVEISAEKVHVGMIKIGYTQCDFFTARHHKSVLNIGKGQLIFKGFANIGAGAKLSIDKDASLIFDNQFWSTGPLLIIARKQIQFGRNCVLSWNISVMDHDAHDIYHGGVLVNTPQPVLFDNHCWIGFNSTILKGSIIPENSVIAANSVITKADFEKNSVIAGVPGMTIKNGINFSMCCENKINVNNGGGRLNDRVILRSISILLVVFVHSFYIYNYGSLSDIDTIVIKIERFFNLDILNKFRMPMFIFISGFLFSFLHYKKHKYPKFIDLFTNKFKRLLIPYWVFFPITALCLGKLTHLSVDDFLYPLGHLWFLLMLFWCFITTKFVLVCHLDRNKYMVLLMFIVAYLLAFFEGNITKIGGLQDFASKFIYFFTGFICYKYDSIFQLRNTKLLRITLLGISAFLLIFLVNILMDSSRFTWARLFSPASSILIVLFGYSVVNRILNKGWIKDISIFEKINKLSYGIYICHPWLIDSITSNKIIISIARDYTLLFPLFLFLFALGVSIFFSKLMLKTKIGRFLIG